MLFLIYFTMLASTLELVNSKPALVEGDVVLDRKLTKIRHSLLSTSSDRTRRSLHDSKSTHEHRWRRGVVPYIISHDIDEDTRQAIGRAFKNIEKYTCVQFTPRKHEKDYVEFIRDKGCYSSIGRQGGRQTISLDESCELGNIIIHELLHTLGMFHEQTRMDRGLYVHVLWWNVQRGAEDNFAIYNHGIIDSMNFPYDYNSATHYHNKEFTKNGEATLESIDEPNQKLGNDYGMSKIDVKKIWQYYKCYKRRIRPQKEICRDKYWWCPKYVNHCATKWLAENYCQMTCKICI